jgi:hypothetical protein
MVAKRSADFTKLFRLGACRIRWWTSVQSFKSHLSMDFENICSGTQTLTCGYAKSPGNRIALLVLQVVKLKTWARKFCIESTWLERFILKTCGQKGTYLKTLYLRKAKIWKQINTTCSFGIQHIFIIKE